MLEAATGGVLKHFGNFTAKRPVLESLFNKVADLWVCCVKKNFLIFYKLLAFSR